MLIVTFVLRVQYSNTTLYVYSRCEVNNCKMQTGIFQLQILSFILYHLPNVHIVYACSYICTYVSVYIDNIHICIYINIWHFCYAPPAHRSSQSELSGQPSPNLRQMNGEMRQPGPGFLSPSWTLGERRRVSDFHLFWPDLVMRCTCISCSLSRSDGFGPIFCWSTGVFYLS